MGCVGKTGGVCDRELVVCVEELAGCGEMVGCVEKVCGKLVGCAKETSAC